MLDAPVNPAEEAADDLLTLNVKSLNLASNAIEDGSDTEVGVEEPVASVMTVVALTWAT